MNGTVSDRRTKILCTIGPSCADLKILKEMMQEGMNAARLNFSHGDYDTHLKTIQLIRQAQKELNIPFTIVQDLQGPKIRIGKLMKPFEIKVGEEIIITIDKSVVPTGEENEEKPRKVSTSYSGLVKDCRIGARLMIDDGYLEVKVKSKNQEETELTCEVVTGGILNQKKGINVIDKQSTISAPALTEKDINDLIFGLETKEIDYVCLSFVRSLEDIKQIKEIMSLRTDRNVPVIAKIERWEAIHNIKEILSLADGLMVARGDLALETDFYELPILQKDLIEISSRLGKIDITATQMLQSMTENKIPTRAEVCDVANSVFDGTDCVMLSNETATGKYPILAVSTLHKIVRTADLNCHKYARLGSHEEDFNSMANDAIEDAICMAASNISNRYTGVKLILCLTHSGKTAVSISQYRPKVPIIALTHNVDTWNRLCLSWGVNSYLLQDELEATNINKFCFNQLIKRGLAKAGDVVVLVLGAQVINHMAQTVRLLKLEDN
ncbi:hypothetical protein ABK040_013037 [Willaertia magna]